MPFQVGDCTAKNINLFAGEPDHHIAVLTKQLPNLPGGVVVVNSHSSPIAIMLVSANRTTTILLCEKTFVTNPKPMLTNPVVFSHPVFPPVMLAAQLLATALFSPPRRPKIIASWVLAVSKRLNQG
jgi:hypothetical protein